MPHWHTVKSEFCTDSVLPASARDSLISTRASAPPVVCIAKFLCFKKLLIQIMGGFFINTAKKLILSDTMSRKYKFHSKEGVYFVSFATVYWLDIFVREVYCNTVVESLGYCRKNKGLEIY